MTELSGRSPLRGDALEPPPRSRRWAVALVVAVVATAAALLAQNTVSAPLAWRAVWAWCLATVLAELLWLPTVTGRATSSMASAVNYATVFVLGGTGAMWTAAVATTAATLLIQRRSLLKVLFNGAQTALAVGAAAAVYQAAGGVTADFDAFRHPALLIPFLNAGIAYYVVNTCLVSAVVALWEGLPMVTVWRQNFGYLDDLLTSAALFLMSPLLVLSYLAGGPAGLALCFVPLVLVRNAAQRYIALREAQEALVWNERMAAMGEMAAEVGHELSNVVQVIAAQAQMLLTDDEGPRNERAKRASRVIFERSADMRRLTRGLVDFSHRQIEPRPENVGQLIRETVSWVEPQNRFDGIDWQLDLPDDDRLVMIDGGQLRQVLINLFRNAQEAMHTTPVRRIRVSQSLDAGFLKIEVADTGPGFASQLIHRVFEPWLTTKPHGHGFGLAVCYRIVRNHGGKIEASNPPGGGGCVTVLLPMRRASDLTPRGREESLEPAAA